MGYKAIPGIYKITNIINNKVYIGSAVSVFSRISSHKQMLNKQKHFNNHLQSSWNKYGASNFTFEMVEQCERELLREREEFWIKTLNSNNNKIGFNRRLNCETNLGIKITEETRMRLRLSHANQKHTIEAREKISKSQWKKVCQFTLDGKYITTFNSLIEAEQLTGVSRVNISGCCRKKTKMAGKFCWCFESEMDITNPPIRPARQSSWTNGVRNKNKKYV